MKQIIGDLNRVRARSRLMLLIQYASYLGALTVISPLVVVGTDYALRFPVGVRVVILTAGIVALGWGLGTRLRRVWRFRPTLTQVALRIERKEPALAGRFASCVEFFLSGLDRENALAARSVKDARARLQGVSIWGVLRQGLTVRWAAVFSVVMLGTVLLGMMQPSYAATGLQRLFLPLGGARWPARTAVKSLMTEVLVHEGVFPRGQALPLRAKNLTPHGEDERVIAEYRILRSGKWSESRRVVLTHQGAGVHERLIDTNGERVEVKFFTADADTEEERIILAPSPAILQATLTLIPPDYAVNRVVETSTELGDGMAHRVDSDQAALLGSRVRLSLLLNKPLPVPASGIDLESWLGQTLSWADQPRPEFSGPGGKNDRWEFSWVLSASRVLNLHLVDEYGLGNNDPIIYRIEGMEDTPPRVTITAPTTDEDVLATAMVPLWAEARDDVVLTELGFEARVQKAGSAASAESSEYEESGVTFDWREVEGVDRKEAETQMELSLPDLGVAEGDVVHVFAVARDGYSLFGSVHDPSRSPVRRLRVIGDIELSSRLRRELGTIRQNAIRIEAEQQELQEDMRAEGVQPGVGRAQGRISDRIASQSEGLEEIIKRMRRNRLDDAGLDNLLAQSGDILNHAGRAANRAGEGIERLEDPEMPDSDSPVAESPDSEPQASESNEESLSAIEEKQQEVRDELTDLIKLLDRDEDAWVVTRKLESLLADQEALEEAAEALGRRTLGQAREELSEEDRTALDRIAEKQRDLRDESRELTDDLRDRAEALEDVDASSASGMRKAAETSERRDLDRDLENAAERMEQNRMQNARQAQAAARQTMQRMLEDIQENQQARAEELLRKLASLQESIERLVRVQENELMALAAIREQDDPEDQPESGVLGVGSRGMVRLHQNTMAVSLEARQAGQETRRIARALDRAADAQGEAVSALRANPVDHDRAQVSEERSLELLREALELSEELEQQTEEQEAQRRREALIEAYRGFAERQVAVREKTLTLAEQEGLERRQLVESRRLGSQQEDIRTGLMDLRDTSSELLEARVFLHMHRLIDEWAREVVEALLGGEPDGRVTNLQQRIASGLGRLIEALEGSNAPPEEFAEAESGSGSGGGGGEPPEIIPPVAELKLLHGLQELVYEQTRLQDEQGDLNEAVRRDRLRELGREQRELILLGEEMLEELRSGKDGE